MPAPISTEGLTKRFGSLVALDGLDLEVRAGEVFGYLGPNGAGKTTTIRLLLDLIRPTSGRASLFGLDPRRGGPAVRRRIGYVPGDLALYNRLTGRELVAYLARLREGRGAEKAEEVAAALDLDLARPIHTLSKGNRQKVGLVQALMHEPDLLVLDEPTSGLDPIVQQRVHQLLLDAARDGRSVFLSSHVLGEVEEVADRVGILRAGRLVAVEEVAALKAKAARRMEVRFEQPPPPNAFAGLPDGYSVDVVGTTAHFVVGGSFDPVVKRIARFPVVTVVSTEPDLEDVFLAYYGGQGRHAA